VSGTPFAVAARTKREGSHHLLGAKANAKESKEVKLLFGIFIFKNHSYF